MRPDISSLVSDLQRALDIRVPCGQITLNMNEGQLQSVETHTKQRVLPQTAYERAEKSRAALVRDIAG